MKAVRVSVEELHFSLHASPLTGLFPSNVAGRNVNKGATEPPGTVPQNTACSLDQDR